MIQIKLLEDEATSVSLPATTNHYHALPRLVVASSTLQLDDNASYAILSKEGSILDRKDFDKLIAGWLADTQNRYISLASKRSDELTASAAQSGTLNDKNMQQRVIKMICAFIKNEKNDEALNINFLQQVILFIRSPSDEITSEIAINSIRILLERIPDQMITLLSCKSDVEPTAGAMKKKSKTKGTLLKLKQTTLMSLLLSSCLNRLTTARAAAVSVERAAKCHAVEIRLACLIAPILAHNFQKHRKLDGNGKLQHAWCQALSQSKKSLVSLFLGLAQSKQNTIAAAITLRSLSIAMHTSQSLREVIGDEELIAKQLIPLLSIIKENKAVVVEVLKLITVLGAASPGDMYLGNDKVVSGLFQTIRNHIPERVQEEFAGTVEDDEEDEYGDGAEEKMMMTSATSATLETAGIVNEADQVEKDDAGEIDMVPWALDVKDYQPKKKSGKRKPSADMDAEILLEPKPSPEEKYDASINLLKIGSFLLWRAMSSFCGTISLSSSRDSDNNGLASRRKYDRHDVNNVQDLDAVDHVVNNLAPFDHSSSNQDMDLLCLLSRCSNSSIRACSLGALATAASNDVMGDIVANSEDERHCRHYEKSLRDQRKHRNSRLVAQHSHRRSWEDFYLDVVQNDKDIQCRLNAVSVLCSLVGASCSSSRNRVDKSGIDYDANDASHVTRRVRIASNPRAAHILSKCMLEENERVHGSDAILRTNSQVSRNNVSFTFVREALCDAISQRSAFVLCEMSLVADSLTNRFEMYSYATQQIGMLDFKTAKRGADTLTSLVQNEEYHEHHEPHHYQTGSHPQHPESVVGVVKRCINVVKGLERSTNVLVDTDRSVKFRVQLLVSLHRALYSMLHRTPVALSILLSQQQHGINMLLSTLDMHTRHSSSTLRYYCMNTIWIMCHHLVCANALIREGLVIRLKRIMKDSEEDEILQVHALEILIWLARGLKGSRNAIQERENQIGLELSGGGNIKEPDNKEEDRIHFGSHTIDTFLINLVLSSYNLKKYHLMSTAMAGIARRCILLRSKRSIGKQNGIRIAIRLLEEKDMGEHTDSIREHAAHALMNLSTESKLQVSICRQGLRTLLSHCGAKTKDNANVSPERDREDMMLLESRLHNLCSRVVSNLTKHKKNRNDIYKAELEIRTHRTRELLANEARTTPRRPMSSRPSSVLASPRQRRNKQESVEEDEDEDEDEDGKDTKGIRSHKKMKISFMDWYAKMEIDTVDEEEKERLAKTSRFLLPPKPPKPIKADRKDKGNPLLIREMRRPLSAMFSPRVKRPMPQTEFSRDTVTPSSFGASIGFGRPSSVLSQRTDFTMYSAYNSCHWGNSDSIAMSGGNANSEMISSSDWCMSDEMNETSQYLPPLAELDLSSANNGGEFFSPFAPAVESVDVTQNLDYEKVDPILGHAQLTEEDEEEDIVVNESDDETDEQQDAGFVNEIEHNKEMAKMLEPQRATEHSIVLQPATPRNTMRFGRSGFARGDNPLLRQTRLWSFHHTPGARVHEGTMTPFTLPDGQQVYLYKKQRMHFADLPWTTPPDPEPVLPSRPPTLSEPTQSRFGPVFRRANMPNDLTGSLTTGIAMATIQDGPLQIRVVQQERKELRATTVPLSTTFAATRLTPMNLLDVAFDHDWNIVKSDEWVQQHLKASVGSSGTFDQDLQVQWMWCRKIFRCVYPQIHRIWVSYRLIVHDGPLLRDSPEKMLRWLNTTCGLALQIDSSENESGEQQKIVESVSNILGKENIPTSCGMFMACLLLACSTNCTNNNVDVFTRLALTLSTAILPAVAKVGMLPVYFEEKEITEETPEQENVDADDADDADDSDDADDVYLASMYRKTHLSMPLNTFKITLYSEAIENLLLPYKKELKIWFTESCSAYADVVTEIIVEEVQVVHSEATPVVKGKGKANSTRSATKVRTKVGTKVGAKHKKSKHHHHGNGQSKVKSGAKRMAVGDWLACLKRFFFLPSRAVSDNEKKNENVARKCFVQSVQMVQNATTHPTNATTLSFTDFLECLVWYAAKGNVIFPTESELLEGLHSPTPDGMLHYLTKVSDESGIRFVGDNAEPFPNPTAHAQWVGDNDIQFGSVVKQLPYKVMMFLTVLMERMQTVQEANSKHLKKKKIT